MSARRIVLLGALLWLGVVTFLHLWLNTRFFESLSGGGSSRQFRVGFLPVT